MQNMSAWMQALSGLAIGMALGFAIQRAKLCTFGAIEDFLMGGDSRRLRVFGLALGIALLGTQALVLGGALNPAETSYTPGALPLLSIAIGSVAFGIGMALVGTCGMGSLVRLGTGDLRSLFVVFVLGAAAYAVLRGLLVDLRIGFLERFAISLPESGMDIAALSSRVAGFETRPLIVGVIGLGLCVLALGDLRLRRTPRLLAAGLVLGLLVTASWIATTVLHDDFSGPARPQSLTFVSTVGKTVYAGLMSATVLADFGVGSVVGIVVGACLAALTSGQFRWEAFDDDREMRRHLCGAALMGVGGVLAGGCTIGQGITAGSMLALSWPIAVAGMIVGARLGIAILVDDSPRTLIQRNFYRLFSRGGS
ncbi:YeeE/YedE family protein [Bradyrhizobium sp. 41S5]|uniref:YeeE/YedE family protein n=1 Tax=Bradyrhizobium sp. 41S5 TaxID=1404443 RepID=UPI00156BD9D3|nr:YeeE/YedE family protein [Bradyrhizobium sp. 41S5]UFX43966.1 YeeE/YedE family protein [Bradyrhizobium sp. 41S5]